MSTTKIRKTLDQLLEDNEYELIPEHINDWHYCSSSQPFKAIVARMKPEKLGNFNFRAAISSPKSIRFRQRDCDFEGGRKGDYLFVDQNGGRFALPYKLFKLLF